MHLAWRQDAVEWHAPSYDIANAVPEDSKRQRKKTRRRHCLNRKRLSCNALRMNRKHRRQPPALPPPAVR